MKKFDELSKEEKGVAKSDFKKSSFGKYIAFSELYLYFCLGVLVLILFTDFLTNLSLFWNIILVILLIVLGEINFYKRKDLVKEYYELKNKK